MIMVSTEIETKKGNNPVTQARSINESWPGMCPAAEDKHLGDELQHQTI